MIALTDNKSQNTLEDEEPAPASKACDTPHLQNTTGQKTAKGTGSGGG